MKKMQIVLNQVDRQTVDRLNDALSEQKTLVLTLLDNSSEVFFEGEIESMFRYYIDDECFSRVELTLIEEVD